MSYKLNFGSADDDEINMAYTSSHTVAVAGGAGVDTFYWGTKDAWINEKDIYTDETLPFILPAWRVQDIDTYDDLKRAEILYEIIERDGY